MLEAIGVREDVPDIAAAVSRLVPVVERTEPPYYIGEVAPVREACNEATYALDAMAARGVDPKTDPQTPGDIIHFVSTVKQRNKFRPKGWEKRCQDWVRNETPYVREFAVFNAPRPLPKVLLDAYRDRGAEGDQYDPKTDHYGPPCAKHRGIQDSSGRDFGDACRPAGFRGTAVIRALVFVPPRSVGNRQARARTHGITQTALLTEIVAIKAEWKRFLQDQGQAIRNGKRLKQHSPEFRRLMNPTLGGGTVESFCSCKRTAAFNRLRRITTFRGMGAALPRKRGRGLMPKLTGGIVGTVDVAPERTSWCSAWTTMRRSTSFTPAAAMPAAPPAGSNSSRASPGR